ncbi:hypothetical protein N7459_006348 [Penicillium hispanicum]|nr:hypothetical protein N7459_006348 [Penicillium hispanicum]
MAVVGGVRNAQIPPIPPGKNVQQPPTGPRTNIASMDDIARGARRVLAGIEKDGFLVDDYIVRFVQGVEQHGAAPPPTKLQACYRPPPPGSRRGSGSPRLPRPPGVSAAALVPPKSRELASARRGRARAAARSSTPPSGPPALPDVRDGESSAEDLSPREVTLQSASQPPGFLPGGRRQPAEVHGPRAYSYPTTTCGAKSPRSGTDSDLEAFSHNPADGSVAALPGQTAAKTNYLNQRFLSY